MGNKSIADLLVDTLIAAGVKRMYGLAGDSLNGITDSIRTQEKIQWIPVRHEESAAFAAGAEAHLTGELAVCAGSYGPGNLHLINGLYDCHRSRVPVLAIAAQVPSHEIGSGYFQETHPEHLFAQCSHYCELISQPEQMPRVLEIAMQTALSRRGVSVIGSVIAPAVVGHSTASALEVAFRRSGEVLLRSALAVIVSYVVSKFWPPERRTGLVPTPRRRAGVILRFPATSKPERTALPHAPAQKQPAR